MDPTAQVNPASIPSPLRVHPIYAGGDRQEVHAATTRMIDPHELRVTGREERLDTRIYGATVGAVTLCYLHYGAAVEILAPGPSNCVCVHFPLGGTAEVSAGSERVFSSRAMAAVPPPFEPLRMRWPEEAAHLIIRVERETLESHLRAHLGSATSKPLRTELGLRLDGPQGRRWLSILQLLQAEIEQGKGPGMEAPKPHVREAAIEDLVINSLLLGHPNNNWALLHRREASARAPYVRKAMEYVRENLHTPITTAILAEVTGVSGRSLQAGFARDLGCSPSAYIRDQRLAKVHAELAAAEPDEGVQVTAVALRAGFSHLGRFSRAYRKRYGEPPSATLRRSVLPAPARAAEANMLGSYV